MSLVSFFFFGVVFFGWLFFFCLFCVVSFGGFLVDVVCLGFFRYEFFVISGILTT